MGPGFESQRDHACEANYPNFLSSVGLEHLVYTEKVVGSNPTGSTMKKLVLILMLLPFMDTPNKKRNRCIDRLNGAQIEEAIIALNHLQKPINIEWKTY